MYNLTTLQNELLQGVGPSGFEDNLRATLVRLLQPYADEISIDTLGNLICRRKGSGPKIVIDAQMDTIGFVVSGVDGSGKISFVPLGNHNIDLLSGEKVQLEGGTCAEIQLRTSEKTPAPEKQSCHDMFLCPDVCNDCVQQVLPNVGTPAVFKQRVVTQEDGLVQAPHLSGVCGAMTAILTMQQLDFCPNDLYFVFSVQSEVGFRGIRSAVYNLEPYAYIRLAAAQAIDATLRPSMGPAIAYKNEYAVWNAEIIDALWQGAEKADITCQYKVNETGAVLPNEVCVQLSRGGVAAGELAIPVLGYHTAQECYCPQDVVHAAKVLCATLESGFNAILDVKIK
ncbi:hypothetical protein ACS3UN_12160 [Oscillospiraceae bacterium LTW-04]|nr:hypothetical protein RBH76_13905 [Oscillospiraceae bacterium MB24-C1]